MGYVAIPATLATMAGCAAINLWLQIRVGQMRGREKVSVGDGNSEPLIRRMRAHANFVENAPFVLALMLALELACGTSQWLWGAGALFLVARVAHGFGMDGGTLGRGRMIGTALSMAILLGLGGWAGVAAYHGCTGGDGQATTAVPVQG